MLALVCALSACGRLAATPTLPGSSSSPTMPPGILQMARAAAEPVHAGTDAMLADSRNLGSEISRISRLLEALRHAEDDSATGARAHLQAAAGKCGMLLQRMVEIEQSKPGNLQTLKDSADLIDGILHDSEKASTLENLQTGVETFGAMKGIWDRIAAESDLADLRSQYRAAQNDLRAAALRLHTAYDQAMGNSVARPGFVGMVIDGNKIVQIMDGSSAQYAGIAVGDRIQDIGGQDVSGLNTQQVRSLLIGPAGTKAVITFANAGTQELVRRTNSQWSLLGHQYHSSMNGTFFADQLTLTNQTGRPLTNCLIRVRRLDAARQQITRVHYCPVWQADSQLHLAYRPESDFQPQESFDDFDTIEVSLISEQLREELSIDYGPAARAADYQAQFQKATLALSRKEYVKGILWDDHRGVRLTMDGVNRLRPGKITVTLHQSGTSYQEALTKTIWWEGSQWQSGEAKVFTDRGFDHILPDGWKVELEFPHTTYRPTFSWGTLQ